MNLLVLWLVKIAKLHSCRNSQNFWDNELILSPPWFFLWLCSIIQVLHHRETVLYHLVQLKPSKSYELRVSYPSTVLYFEFCFVWVSNFWSQDPASSHRWVKVLCLWARHLVTTLPLINHRYKEVSQIPKGKLSFIHISFLFFSLDIHTLPPHLFKSLLAFWGTFLEGEFH